MHLAPISRALACAISALILAACGGGGGGGNNVQSPALTGTAAKGFIKGARINAFKADGSALGSATTDNNGGYSIALNGYTGPVRIEVVPIAGSEVFDEVDQQFKPLPASANAILSSVGVVGSGEPTPTLHATPFTSIAAKLATSGNTLDERRINAAVAAISTQLGFPVNVTKPVNPGVTGSANENDAVKSQAVLLAGIANWVPPAEACAGVVNGTAAATRGSAEQFKCAVEALKNAFEAPEFSGSTVAYSLNGRMLAGLTQAVAQYAADGNKNKTGKRINSNDGAVSKFDEAERSPQPTRQTVEVSDANKTDVEAVKSFVSKLRANAAAMRRQSDNDALITELREVEDNFVQPGLAFASTQLGYLQTVALGVALLKDYEGATSNRPVEDARIGFTERYKRRCVVVEDNVTRDANGFVTGATLASTSADNSNTILCLLLGDQSALSGDPNVGVVRDAYSFLIRRTGENAYAIESDSRSCRTNPDTRAMMLACRTNAASKIETARAENGKGGTLSATRTETESGGRVTFNLNSKFVSLLEVVNNAFASRGILHEVLGAFDISATDDIGTFNFNLDIKNTDKNNRLLRVKLNNPGFNVTSLETEMLAGKITLLVSAPEGSVEGGIDIDNTGDPVKFVLDGTIKVVRQGTLTTLFNGKVTVTGKADESGGSITLDGTVSLPNRPALVGTLTVSGETVNGREVGSVSATYNQDGAAFSISVTGIDELENGSLTINLLSIGATITGKERDRQLTVVKNGKVLARVNQDRSEIVYADGLTETY